MFLSIYVIVYGCVGWGMLFIWVIMVVVFFVFVYSDSFVKKLVKIMRIKVMVILIELKEMNVIVYICIGCYVECLFVGLMFFIDLYFWFGGVFGLC